MYGEDITHLTKVPLLTESEERLMVRKAKRGDQAARDRLVEANMRLVTQFAKPYANCGIPFADLLTEGAIGLMQAIDKFDPTRGYRFTTYAGQWVRHALSRAVDDKSKAIRLPSYVHEYARKINKARSEYKQAVGAEPQIDELALWMGWEPKKLQKVLSQLRETVSLDDPVGDTTLGNLIEAPGLLPTNTECDIFALLGTLNSSEKAVLTARLNEVKLDGLSRERIKSLEATALKKLADAARMTLLRAIIDG